MSDIKLNKPVFQEWSNYNRFDSDKWVAEPKLDGERFTLCNINGNLELVKNGVDHIGQFPEFKEIQIPENTILDGELCILENGSSDRADFNKILKRSTLNQMMIRLLSSKMPATFVAFDIIQHEESDMRSLPYYTRRSILTTIPEQGGLNIINSYKPSDINLDYLQQKNMEGIVVKAKDSTYFNQWFKLKNFVEGDFKVVKVNSESRLISSLDLIEEDGTDVGAVNYINYPQTDEMREKLPGMTAVVRYMKSSTQKLRFPVLKELRV